MLKLTFWTFRTKSDGVIHADSLVKMAKTTGENTKFAEAPLEIGTVLDFLVEPSSCTGHSKDSAEIESCLCECVANNMPVNAFVSLLAESFS